VKKSESSPELTTEQNVIQVLKFVVFSCSAGIIQIISFTLLNELASLPYWPCYLVALTLSVLYNFTVNRRFTFKSASNVPIAMMKVAGFYAVFTPLSTWLGNLAEESGINEYIILGVTMVCNLITEFLFCRFVVYRNSINTNKAAIKAAAKSDAANNVV
jgi:putative flippase GtrA